MGMTLPKLTATLGSSRDPANHRDCASESAKYNTIGTQAGPIAAVAVVFVALAIRFFNIVDHYAVDIFFGDHWAFEDSTLFHEHSWLEIFRWQYGPHRQGLGGLLLAIAEPLFHWNQRCISFGIALIIACACLAALCLKHRIFGRFGYSDVIIPLLFFTPVQYEILLGANNPSHGPLPLMLVVLYCLAWTIDHNLWRYGTVLLLNVLLIYTGFGLFMGLITPALFGLKYFHNRERKALISLVLAVLSLGSFFIGYRNDPAVECFSPYLHGHLHYFVFIAFMFSTFVKMYPAQSTVIPAFLTGSILVTVAAVSTTSYIPKLVRERTSSLKLLEPFLLLSYSLIFCCAAAYGRTCESVVPGPRYMIYLIPAFFGLYLAALSEAAPVLRREYVGVVLLVSLLSSAWISANELRTMSTISRQRRGWKDCYVASHSIGACDAVSRVSIYATPEPPDLHSKLDFLEKRHLSLFSVH